MVCSDDVVALSSKAWALTLMQKPYTATEACKSVHLLELNFQI